MLAPGSEAPSEMLWYVEEKKAIEAAKSTLDIGYETADAVYERRKNIAKIKAATLKSIVRVNASFRAWFSCSICVS